MLACCLLNFRLLNSCLDRSNRFRRLELLTGGLLRRRKRLLGHRRGFRELVWMLDGGARSPTGFLDCLLEWLVRNRPGRRWTVL